MSNDFILGIDTSNYTTSAALFSVDGSAVMQKKRLLPVKSGERGLRQSDAVFHHTQQLHTIIRELLSEACEKPNITAVGVSYAPTPQEGSYMPCFTVGDATANVIGSVLSVPVYRYSHQEGHIAAAVYSSGHEELYEREFVAFHVSGGTTEAVIAAANESGGFTVRTVGKSLDLHAGQAIDRVGVRLGCDFPCGVQMERLAMAYSGEIKVKPCVKGCDCCLSGVENKCDELIRKGAEKSYVAAYCLKYISVSIEGMCRAILSEYGNLPLLFAGGVMSDSIIKEDLSRRFDCVFAQPEFSCDNAVGVAALAQRAAAHGG